MEYETEIQRDICEGLYYLRVIVPIKHILQIIDFISGLNTNSEIKTSALTIIIYNNNENVLQYIDYELGKFIGNIENAERCYNELFMEVKA